MPNATASQGQHGGQDKDQGADESWSSDNGSHRNGSRGVKRKRPFIVSCELCKLRKVKCDRAQPSCGWCSRNGQLCEYKERKKPGLRAGYGKELEQRLDKLEQTIQSQGRLIETRILNQPRLAHDLPQPGPFPYNSPSEIGHGPSPNDGLCIHKPSPVTVHRDVPVASPSDLSSKNSVHNQSNGIRIAPRLPETPGLGHQDYKDNESSLTVPVNLFSSQERSFADPELDFPPYDLLYSLVDLYFEHVGPWCPILHRRTTLDNLFGPSPLAEEDRMVLYAIVATTLRFSTDSRLNEQNRKRYHDSSKQKVLLYGLENSSIKALQALVILALDLVGSSNGPPGWKLLALITRSVVQLGLAVESKSRLIAPVYPSIYTLRAVVLPEPESWIEDESRRRLFWMVYILDRYSTIVTAFDFALGDKDIDRKLPCRDEYFIKNQPVETRWFRHHANNRVEYTGRAENVGYLGLYVEILGILSRIHLFLKEPVDIGCLSDVEEWQTTYRKLDSELTAWEFNLPPEYAYQNSSQLFSGSKHARSLQCGWVQLHATYQTAVIRLHSSAAYPTTRSPIFTPSYSASQRCLLAVDNILSVTGLVTTHSLLTNLGPPFAFTLWVSARLLLVHGSTIARTVNPEINFFVDTLARMGGCWKVAERYSSILKRVLDEYWEYQQASGDSGMGNSEEQEQGQQRSTPSTVKILADMRRCAFDLDFLISRQPRASPSVSSVTTANNNSANSDSSQQQVLPMTFPAPRNLAPHELEYLDVFGFFNVPRVSPSRALGLTTAATNLDVNADSENANGNDNNLMSTNGLTEGAAAAAAEGEANAAGAVMDGPSSASNMNEFNITNYLIPTPETDWLFRAAG